MAMSGGQDNGEPMIEMNVTPMIDVLLVLLILFIITIPPQTHAVKVDLPQNSPPTQVVQPDKNTVSIDAMGQVAWNGTPVDDVTLRQYLDASLALPTEPELHFQPTPDARYEKVDQVLAIIKRSGVTRMGFIGNEQYRNDF
jgi:biopolymer transport protein ExbD